MPNAAFTGIRAPEYLKPRLPVAGTLKIGEVVEGAKGRFVPRKLAHFRYCTGAPTGKGGTFAPHPKFEAENAAQPMAVPVELFSDDPALNLEVAYELVGGPKGRVICHGNGETAMRRLDKDGKWDVNAPFRPVTGCGEACPHFVAGKCKLAAVLKFRVPGHTPLGTVWTLRTHGRASIEQLQKTQGDLKAMTGGRLSRFPLELAVAPVVRSFQGENGLQMTTFHAVHLQFPGSTLDLARAVAKAREEEAAEARLLGTSQGLPGDSLLRDAAPMIGSESDLEAAAVGTEFFHHVALESGELSLHPQPQASVALRGQLRALGSPLADAPDLPEEDARQELFTLRTWSSPAPRPLHAQRALRGDDGALGS